jgi:hypothetical protein
MYHENIQMDILIQHISQEVSQYVLIPIYNKYTQVIIKRVAPAAARPLCPPLRKVYI